MAVGASPQFVEARFVYEESCVTFRAPDSKISLLEQIKAVRDLSNAHFSALLNSQLSFGKPVQGAKSRTDDEVEEEEEEEEDGEEQPEAMEIVSNAPSTRNKKRKEPQ
jgi:hypothetical protein